VQGDSNRGGHGHALQQKCAVLCTKASPVACTAAISCTRSAGQPAGHVLTHEQQQLLARASDLELEQRQHAAAAAEAARIAAAAAARASELETEIKLEVTERRTLLLQQEEVSC
jgi:hypothetical protein